MMEVLYPAIAAGITAGIYGGYAYLAGRIGTPGEKFEYKRLLGTIVVGAAVGLGFTYMGIPVNEAAVVAAMTTIGAVEVGQKTIEGLVNLGNVIKGYLIPKTA